MSGVTRHKPPHVTSPFMLADMDAVRRLELLEASGAELVTVLIGDRGDSPEVVEATRALAALIVSVTRRAFVLEELLDQLGENNPTIKEALDTLLLENPLPIPTSGEAD